MAAGTDHMFMHWKSGLWHFSTIIFIVVMTVDVSNFTAGTPCTEGIHTCNQTTQLCNDTQGSPGYVCTCINDTQQLSAHNTCVPVPESQRLYLFTKINVPAIQWSQVSEIVFTDFKDEEQRKTTILNFFPPSMVLSLKTVNFINLVVLKDESGMYGTFAVLYSLIFGVNVTSQIKESVARRVLELEAGRYLTIKETKIPIAGYMGIFDTKDQMNSTNDTIDWCSSPSLFSCRSHSTCFDGGLRYTCPCKVGYYNSSDECNLAVRLAGVQEKLEGRLEYYPEEAWKTICQKGFTSRNAVVACRQLGLPSRGAVYYEDAVYGEGTGDVHMYRMTCTGRELALSQCPSEPLPPGSCNHTMDVGIRCDTVCVDDYHFGLNCSQPCLCNVSNTDLCDRDNGTCYCKAGWEGVTCDDDVDECAQSGACRGALERCQNTEGSFLCLCVHEAERNRVGVCTGTDELVMSTAPSAESSSPLGLIAGTSAGGVVLVIIIIVTAVVIVKSRARAHEQTTGLSIDSTGYSDLGASNIYDDLETYDKVNDENSSRDSSTPYDTISREGQTILVNPQDESDGYCSALDDVTRETSRGQDAIQGCYRDRQKGPHHGYLHACATTPDPTHLASVVDDFIQTRSVDYSDTYLHPASSLYKDNNMASVNRTADENAGDRDNSRLDQSSLDADVLSSEREDYLPPVYSAVEAEGAASPVNFSSPGSAKGASSGDDLLPTGMSSPGLEVTMSPACYEQSVDTRL